MTKKEVVIAAAGFVAAVVLIGGGLWWHSHQLTQKKALNNTEQAAQTSDAGTGLSVNGSGASNLGQLDSKGGQSQGSNNGNSSGSSGNSGGIDPSTFAQYDKYKNNQDALFGDIKAGTGTALVAGKKGTVYYKGWLTNGALIDQSPASSSGQPQPYTFTLGAHEVIPGWEEAIYGMKAAGTRLLIIPPAVGYGSQGKGAVPPNAVLVFEVQLLSVQ